MIINCEKCNSQFNLKDSLIKETGSKVRCSGCKHVFTVYPPSEDQDAEAPEIDELDLSLDFDGDSDAEKETAEPSPKDIDDFDFSDIENMLDTDMASGQEEDKATNKDEEDLSLDLDIPFELTQEEIDADERDVFDFSDVKELEGGEDDGEELELDLDLDLDGMDGEDAEIDTGDDFDFSEVESMIDKESKELAKEGDEPESMELDLDLDLDIEPGDEEAAIALEEESEIPEENDSDDFDFSDVEAMIDTEKAPDRSDVDEDMDLELELSDEDIAAAEKEEDDAFDDLRLELDMELSDGGDAKQESVTAETEGESDGDFALEMEGDSDDNLDFSDLESMIDTEKVSSDQAADTDAGEMDDLGLNLDFDMEDAGVGTEEDHVAQEAEELLPDLETQLEASSDVSSGDPDDDFELSLEEDEEEEEEEEIDKTQFIEDAISQFDGTEDEVGETVDAFDKRELAAPIVPEAPKRGGMLVFLIIFLVFGSIGGGGAYVYLNKDKLDLSFLTTIPGLNQVGFIKELAGTDQSTKVAIVPVQESIQGRFVQNKKDGTLFVISGKVRNSSKENFRQVKIKGALISKNGKVAKSEVVVCGNTLTDTELENLSIADIKKRLKDNQIKQTQIGLGKQIPFLVAFSNLPSDLENYEVEILEPLKEE